MPRMVSVLMCCLFLSSCSTAVMDAVFVYDYRQAGESMGEAGYRCYSILKAVGKHPSLVAEIERIYGAVDSGESLDALNVNIAFLHSAREALSGFASEDDADRISMVLRIGGRIADLACSGKLDKANADAFLSGFVSGVRKARSASIY